MRSRNTLSLTLMVTSLVLLVVLQFLWLQSAYERAFFDFRRETSWLFRNTIGAMRDSLLARNTITLPGERLPELAKGDTVLSHFGPRGSTRGFVETEDTLQRIMSSSPRLATHMQDIAIFKRRGHGPGQNFAIIRLIQDSLSRDSIRLFYGDALHRAGINSPFIVKHIRIEPAPGPPGFDDDGPRFQLPDRENRRSIYRDELTTERARFSPHHNYQASISSVRAIILRQILPQMLFSLFLTTMITIVFVMMYRNMRAQQRLMDMKNDFISNITHELKTPMATVSVALEALKNFHVLEKPELTEEYLTIAQAELNRLTLMTDKILKASSFESKGVSFIPEPVNLDMIISKILTSLKLIFEKRGAEVNYYASGTNFAIQGSETHLTNVLYNLVDNALKYGGTNPMIDLELKSQEDHIHIAVRDQGIGIPREYQQKIFEKFFRVPTGDIHNTKGYGLGLSYVASVVKSHHGTIMVDSEPGRGSSFILSLPRCHDQD